MADNERSSLDDYLENEAKLMRSQQSATIDIATKQNPDKYATINSLSKTSGLPKDVIERNTEEVQRKQRSREIQTIIDTSPVLSKKFSSPDFAQLAHDDVESLFKVEASLKPLLGPEPSIGSVSQGVISTLSQGLELTRQGIRMQWADFIGSERMKKDAMNKFEIAQTDVILTNPNFESSTARGIYGGVTSFMRQIPGFAASIATRSPGPLLATMGQMTEAEAYGKYRARGGTPTEAAIGGMAEGATEVLTELMPMSFLVGKFGKVGAGEFLTGLLARELPTEQVATLVQDAVDTAIANPDKTWMEYLKERPGAAYETLLSTLVQSGIMGGLNVASQFATGTVKADKAIEDQKSLDTAVEAAAESKLRERSPEEYKDFLDNVLGADNNVYISPEDAEVFFQSNPDVLDMLDERSPEVSAAIKESLAGKSDVVIPKSDYLTYLTDLHEELSPILRNDQDGMTVKEAEQFVQEAGETFDKEAEQILVEQEKQLETDQSAEKVFQNVKDQLVKTGRFNEGVAEKYALLHKAFAQTMAGKLNLTPEQVYEKLGLKIQGAPIAGETLSQSTRIKDESDVSIVSTGNPVIFNYIHNKESATKLFGKPKKGDRYGRDYEPSGKYITILSKNNAILAAKNNKNIETGELAFSNPLVIPNNNLGWKKELSDKYGGKTGKKLSLAIINDGYDGVITTEDKYISEALDLTSFNEAKALYQEELVNVIATTEVDGESEAFVGKLILKGTKTSIVDVAGEWKTFNNEDIDLQEGGEFYQSPIETQEFKNWFGDSKVVDEQGKPLVVYHGTNQSFESFSKERLGENTRAASSIAFFFTENPQEANEYAEKAGNYQIADAVNVEKKSAELQKKISMAERKADWDTVEKLTIELEDLELGAIREDPSGQNVIPVFLTIQNPKTIDMNDSFDGWEVAREIKEAKKQGYDGLKLINVYDPVAARPEAFSTTQYVAFSPEQIKSAIGNRGTFDPNDPNILYQSSAGQEGLINVIATTEVDGESEAFVGKLILKGTKTSIVDVAGEWKTFNNEDIDLQEGGEFYQSPVETQEFKNWFGDSKVVDGAGEPLIYYHGGEAGITVFDDKPPERGNLGAVYLTDNKMVAANYALTHGILFDDNYNIVLEGKKLGEARKKGISYEYPGFNEGDKRKIYSFYVKASNFLNIEELSAEDVIEILGINSVIEAIKNDDHSVLGDIISEKYDREIEDLTKEEIIDFIDDNFDSYDMDEMRDWFEFDAQMVVNNSSSAFKFIGAANIIDEFISAAAKKGYDSIEIRGDWDTMQESNTLIVFDSKQVKSATKNIGTFDPNNPNILLQQQRGSFQPGTNLISLLETADLSTFLHESGHFFLEAMNSMPELNQDMDVIFKWFGTTRWEWEMSTLEEKRDWHEQFARGFESYLMEGKAPSLELQSVFQRFRDWLINIYKNLKNLNVKLTPEVRQVFDRMLATEEQIREAEAARAYEPIFKSIEESGQSEKWWQDYQKLDQDRRTKSREELQTRSLQDMKWMSNAKSKALRDIQKDVANKRKAIREEVSKEVSRETVYRAIQFFRRGEIEKEGETVKVENHRLDIDGLKQLYDGIIKTDPNIIDSKIDEILIAITKLGGLNKEEAERQGIDPENWKGRNAITINQPIFGKRIFHAQGLSFDDVARQLSQYGYKVSNPNDLLDAITDSLSGNLQYSNNVNYSLLESPDEIVDWRSLGHGKYGMLAKDGLDPEDAAHLFNYPSADQMIRDMLEAPPKKEYIDAITDQRMLETYGDISTPLAMERAAEEAIHNDVHTRFLHTELKALTKGEGQKNVLAKAAKQFATDAINKKKIKDIKPGQYLSSQTRAGNNTLKALAKGDRESAIDHKRAQVLNNHFYRVATQASKDIDKMLRYVKKFTKEGTRKNLDPEYLEQIDDLLGSFEIKNVSLKKLEKRQLLADFIKQQEEEGFQPAIDEALINETKRKNYKLMTFEEFRGHVETIEHIEHLGRLKKKLLTAKDRREFNARMDEARLSIELNKNRKVKEAGTPTDTVSKLSAGFKQFAAIHRKAASIVREMDGSRDNGVMWNLFVRSVNEAGDKSVEMKAEASEQLGKLFDQIKIRSGVNNIRAPKYVVPGTNISMTDEQRLMFALNWGNEGNRQRLLDGGLAGKRQLTSQDAQAILDTLSKQELGFVQGVFDFIETYKDQIGEQEKRLTGKTPKWIEPSEIKTKNGTIKGGYFPAKYDTVLSTRSESLEAVTNLRLGMKGAFNASATRSGYTKERANEVKGRPLLLSFGVINQHVNEVIHRLSYQDWVSDANRILKALDPTIREYYGPEIFKELRNTVKDVAEGDKGAANIFESIINHARVGATIVGMGFRITTAAIQPTGFAQSIYRIGVGSMGRGLKEFITSPVKAYKNVMEKSAFMRDRNRNLQREVSEVMNKVRGKDKVGFFKQHAFYLISKTQIAVDIPTWLGAYDKALIDLKLENAKDQTERNSIEETAIQLANQAVRDSQSAGLIFDQAGIQRGSPLLKLFTNFYSYFSATYNLNVEAYRKANLKSPKGLLEFTGDIAVLNFVPTVMAVLIYEAIRGDCDGDMECLGRKYADEQISFLMGQLVGVRELSGAVTALSGGKAYGYQGAAGMRVISEIQKAGQQAAQGEFDEAARRSLLNVTGMILHLPLGQVNTMLDGIAAVENGETEGARSVLAPLVGPPRE